MRKVRRFCNWQPAERDRAMLDRIRDELSALAAVHRKEGDVLRHLPPALAEAFLRHDVYRLLLPVDLGGAGVDPLDYLQLVEDVSRVDGSIGWNLTIAIGSGLYLGYIPPAHARAISARPDCGIAGAYAPMGRGEAVEGGYRVSGHWSWASGAADARWMVFGFSVAPPGPDGKPEARAGLAPRDAFHVLDNWYTGGMRGTGSTDYEVEDLFVPADMTFRMFVDAPRHPAPLFRLPGVFFAAAVATVALGIARGAAEGLIALADAKRAPPGRTALRDQPYAQYAVAKALALAESSSVYLRQAIGEVWRLVQYDQEIALADRARARRACVHAAEASAEAVDMCCRAAGGNALREGEPFERAQRDAHAVLGHIVLQRGAMEDVGRAEFGLAPFFPVF
jgi:alkylation response protein AidB-like acyl-CoA dehydrogenase